MLCNNLDIGGPLKFRPTCVSYSYIHNKSKSTLLISAFLTSILLGANSVINGDIFFKKTIILYKYVKNCHHKFG